MKLEAGKFYKTRDGRKAFVAAVSIPYAGPSSSRERALGYIEADGGLSIDAAVWFSDGTNGHHGRGDEIVAEWSEISRGECWVNIYPNGHHDLFGDRKHADEDAPGYVPARIARVRVPWIEGQFDE